MTSRATISFSQPGLQPPVYVVTSLSSPPWQPLELNPTSQKTPDGHTIFSRSFDNAAQGTYQYKIRLGEDHWIVDESTETATDDVGNRNNVVHVNPDTQPQKTTFSSSPTTDKDPQRDTDPSDIPKTTTNMTEQAEEKKGSTVSESGSDSALALDTNTQLPTVPVPFVVVEKVVDKERPEYGDTAASNLSKDSSKRAADADPDFEEVRPESPVDSPHQDTPPVPLVVVEKTDDKPSYGDDFGKEASSAQKLAHDLRVSDAKPDQVVVKHDHFIEPGTPEEQAAPLLPHEIILPDSHPPSPGSPMETIEEESSRSSPDQTDSATPANPPVKDSKSGSIAAKDSDLDRKPWLSLETGSSGEEVSEFCHSPLMSHETTYSVSSDAPSELDQAPLLPHEMDDPRPRSSFARRGSHQVSDDDDDYGDGLFESMRAPTFSHEEMQLGSDDDPEAPLLPHERDSVAGDSHSECSANGDHQPYSYQPTTPSRLFQLGHPPAYRSRKNSSSLPHKLPQSDEEDENLHDPSLEPFPTSRDKILEQVATIGHNLPEDETHGTSLHSPHFTVMSQACSSVDLAPVRSYTSLQSVVEESVEEENSEPSSPVFGAPGKDEVVDHALHLGEVSSSNQSRAVPVSTENPTQISEEDRNVASDIPTDKQQTDNKDEHKNKSSEGAHDGIGTSSKVVDPPTPPLTPEKSIQKSAEEQPKSSQEALCPSDPNTANTPTSAAKDGDSGGKKDGVLHNIFWAIFGSLSRFLGACFGGDKKHTVGAVMVIGIAMAAYYYVYVLQCELNGSWEMVWPTMYDTHEK